jgi:di/tricarboxylate transporter
MIVFSTLILALVLFIQGKWRYDTVALMALLVLVIAGIVPGDEAFLGFGHPAVVTVAAVLVIGRALANAGIVDRLARLLSISGGRPVILLFLLTGLVVLASGFMNNVGALALFMPVCIRMARKNQLSPSLFLMPLAFGSLLGGLITLIGTPPNIIVASFRDQSGAGPFGMFDFAPVGVGVALAGSVFMILAGRRLIPERKGQASAEELFQIESYLSEVRVPDTSKIVGKSLRELEVLTENDVLVVGLVRGKQWFTVPSSFEIFRPGDILIVEAASDDLKTLVDHAKLELVGSKDHCLDFLGLSASGEEAKGGEGEGCKAPVRAENMGFMEAVVQLESPMVGRTVRDINLRWRHGLNLLAVARQGSRVLGRLKDLRFKAGDILLLQGAEETFREALPSLGCFPLAERALRLKPARGMFLSLAVFSTAVVVATLGLIPIQAALVAAALILVMTGIITLNEAYRSVDWPIIILLGAMFPIGLAMESTGGAALVASGLFRLSGPLSPAWILILIQITSMLLSNLINNAATAMLMAPIAVSTAAALNVSLDPFLMAIAIGASSPFLTPIGHQSNTLVMGPGGYRFQDYWRMGLPLSLVVMVISIPLILRVWPL